MGYEALVYLDNPETYLEVNSNLSNNARHGLRFSLSPFFPNFKSLIHLTDGLRGASGGFIIIIAFIIICATIITTIILLSGRKYEMAVLRSVGMDKVRLILGYLVENMIFIWSITAVSLIIAQFVGLLLTNYVFEGMQSMISPEIYKTLIYGANNGLLLHNIGFIFGGTTVVVILSLVLTCINIISSEPLKIFNKRYS